MERWWFGKLVLDDFVTKGFLTLLKLIRDRPEGHKALFFLSINMSRWTKTTLVNVTASDLSWIITRT